MATMTSKDERIKKERDKLTKQFSAIDERRKRIVEKTIDNCAYMSVILEDLKAQMDAKGDEAYVSVYQNGENQWGTKKSPEVEIYNTMIKNHMAIIKQLSDLLPKQVGTPGVGDDLEEFVGSK